MNAQTSFGTGTNGADTVYDCMTAYVEGVDYDDLTSSTINGRLGGVYTSSQYYPTDGTGTSNLMAAIAMKESSCRQFATREDFNSRSRDLFDLVANYDIYALFPHENQIPGSGVAIGDKIGLMQVDTTSIDAWDWEFNTCHGVTLFAGDDPTCTGLGIFAPSGVKLALAAAYENAIINGGTYIPPGKKKKKSTGSPLCGLPSLNGYELENMALVLYAGDLGPCLNKGYPPSSCQYYIPQCPSKNVTASATCGPGGTPGLECQGGWQWVANIDKQSAGISYVHFLRSFGQCQ